MGNSKVKIIGDDKEPNVPTMISSKSHTYHTILFWPDLPFQHRYNVGIMMTYYRLVTLHSPQLASKLP